MVYVVGVDGTHVITDLLPSAILSPANAQAASTDLFLAAFSSNFLECVLSSSFLASAQSLFFLLGE